MIKRPFVLAWLACIMTPLAHADTPPLRAVNSMTYNGAGTVSIGATGTALNTYFTNASIPVTQSGTWSEGRTWTLGYATDAVTAIPPLDGAYTFTITAGDTASSTVVAYNNQTWYTGTPTSGSVASLALISVESGYVQTSGTWTGILQVEVSLDGGTTWIAHAIHQIGSAAFFPNFTNNVGGSLNLSGKTHLRVRALSGFSGSAGVRLTETVNPSNVYVANSIKLVDGSAPTSTTAMNIAPSSTAPSATQTAVVVGLSPNGNQSTAALQTTINTAQTSGAQKTQIVDGLGNVIGSNQNNLNVSNAASFKTLTGAATTVIKTGAGILFTVCINNVANGNTLTLYDNTAGSGNVMLAPAVVTGGLGLGAYVETPTCLNTGGVLFTNGLTAVVAGTASSFSVFYK